MVDLSRMTTESRNIKSMKLDEISAAEIVRIMNEEDSKVHVAVGIQLDKIAQVVTLVAQTLEHGGRLIYIGAGTSGRLGLLDAVECPPTFGTSSETIVGLIAGGEKAFIKAVEGAEDSPALCVEDLKKNRLES